MKMKSSPEDNFHNPYGLKSTWPYVLKLFFVYLSIYVIDVKNVINERFQNNQKIFS